MRDANRVTYCGACSKKAYTAKQCDGWYFLTQLEESGYKMLVGTVCSLDCFMPLG